jgi:hypothetical protein
MAKTKQTQLHKEIDLVNDNRSSYDMVVLSSLWAKHIRKKEEFAGITVAEIIKTAMTDVCTGKVSKKQITDIIKEGPSKRYHARQYREKGKGDEELSAEKKS